MPISIEGSELTSNKDVAGLLAQLRRDPRTSNPRVLSINMIRQMQARNNGYPIDMCHAELNTVRVNNEEEEAAIAQAGFQRTYIPKRYPIYMFRRNMHPKFAKSKQEQERIGLMTAEAQKIERETINPDDFVEERLVADEAAEKKLLAEAATKNVSAWVHSMGALAPMKQGPDEDPEVTIARMEGELAALREGGSKRKAS